ncbi:methyltransferase [Tersicoccus solisilvae]|uniref:Methyltransferase n=1 Tax=Tersicoccus solisilvae TaxID=1882339 RepID=A0ABQ1PEN6_9MICC|nr:class I SAM-dependent methyltransferase [Tersicoccus solisilvae]GGC95663.1 methyltransferase [Tersicoccus solisilvae]
MRLPDRLRLIARVARLRPRASRNRDGAWTRFWAGIADGELTEPVLWEGRVDAEAQEHLERVAPWVGPGPAVLDVGCGTGWLTAALARTHAPTIGVDVAPDAIALARRTHPGVARFETADLTDPATAAALHAELGDCHVVVRGVLHVLAATQQRALVAAIRILLGGSGRLYLAETNVGGGPLDYLTAAGAGAGGIPGPLAQAIRTLPRPGHVGPAERAALFPAPDWDLLADGPARLGLAGGSEVDAYWAVLQPRR